jgi:hypothetical protein
MRWLPFRSADYDRVDLACLVNAEELELRQFIVTNYHLLPKLKTAVFSCCEGIDDVSCFSRLSSLSLEEMPDIVDVSPLKDVPRLIFMSCLGITDVSSLGKVHELAINHCQNISDVSHWATFTR